MYGECPVMLMGGGGGGTAGPLTGPAGNSGSVGTGNNMMMFPPPPPSSSALSDHPFYSSPHRNPNHSLSSLMASLPPFHGFSSVIPKEEGQAMGMNKEMEMESGGSGSAQLDGAASGDEQDDDSLFAVHQQPQGRQQNGSQAKKKRYHRHTAHQIQEMEALFKECPHPDDKQRLKLSQDLGLKPRQVKFWFQNRRTQMKAQQDRADNVMLRAENETLKNENYRLQAAMRSVMCPTCGGPAVFGEISMDEQHFRLENARLKDELERLSCIIARHGHRPMPSLVAGTAAPPQLLLTPSLDLDMGIYARHFSEQTMMNHCGDVMTTLSSRPPAFSCGSLTDGGHGVDFPGEIFIMDQDKGVVVDLAMAAAEQIVKLSGKNEPLWARRTGSGAGYDVLDLEEYHRVFQWPPGLKQSRNNGDFCVEATRDSALVIMNGITLVNAFMDVGKWMEMFPSVVSNARTIQVLSSGISGHGNGSLHLMYAEFQFLSPLVPVREAYFFRYCQQNSEEGTWTIVDFPVDGICEGLQVPLTRYRRRPSGCLIQDMPNGYSKVTWVEFGEVEDKPVHQIFSQLVSSGMAFSSQRWLGVLQRQCERLASLLARNISDLGVIPSPEARRNMMRLSQRMVRTFCNNISSSGSPSWTALSDSPLDTVRVTTRKNMEPGQPNGVILCAVSTTWLPYSADQVFDVLTDEKRRSQLDVLSGGNSLEEVAHIANGSHQRNCVSLLRINASSNSSQTVELMLQESSIHPTAGGLVVCANVDVNGIQLAMSGDDPSCIPLLPMGFVVIPASPPPNQPATETAAGSCGSLLTVGLQVLASTIPSAKLNLSSVNAINNHLCNAVQQISAALVAGADAAAK
ncbi:homeobox-7 [Wolffia australiana]